MELLRPKIEIIPNDETTVKSIMVSKTKNNRWYYSANKIKLVSRSKEINPK
jgi:hypothetical protein